MASDSIQSALSAELHALDAAGRLRGLSEAGGRDRRFDFTSNDYLGLAHDPRVVEAISRAAQEFGAGGRAARLLGGGAGQARLERVCAEWLGDEAALLFPSGYQANVGLLTSILGGEDVVFSDELNHASLIDGMRLSKARRVIFGHLDLTALEAGLMRSMDARRRIIVVESVFSMDGDSAPLDELHSLAERYDAWLVLDEAHAVGLLGQAGAGLGFDLAGREGSRVLARVITGGKALGGAGALVVGSAALIDVIANRARAFIFTTAPPPSLAAGLLAAIGIVRSAAELRTRALSGAKRLAASLGLPIPAAAIVPIPIGDEAKAMDAAAKLRSLGFDVRAVRPPTVPVGTSRLRVVCHAWQTDGEIDALIAAIQKEVPMGSHTIQAPKPAGASERPSALFVAGTDTDIGKTVVAALLCRAWKRALARDVHYWKPVQTGDDSDTQSVARLAQLSPSQVEEPAWHLKKPASPHEAAAAEDVQIDPDAIFRRLAEEQASPVVIELAGGLMVPYTTPSKDKAVTQLDWLAQERAPFVLVARSGVGTLNHTMLSLGALKARHLAPLAIILVGEPHPENAATLREWTGLQVLELPHLAPLNTQALDDWIKTASIDWLPTS